jgi:hypothetical protein
VTHGAVRCSAWLGASAELVAVIAYLSA